MIKTEVYVGEIPVYSKCTLLCVLDGILYDSLNSELWVKDPDTGISKNGLIMQVSDKIESQGITRRIRLKILDN